jgi:hypothetical protein
VCGETPLVPWQLKYEWAYLWLVAEPLTGEVVAAWFPTVNQAVAEVFLEEVRDYFPGEDLLIIWDNAPWHQLSTPKIQLQPLPAYSPELNPVERINEELRRTTANQVWDQLELKVDKVDQLLKDYFEHPDKVRQLTLFPWIQKQLNSLTIPEC